MKPPAVLPALFVFLLLSGCVNLHVHFPPAAASAEVPAAAKP